MPQNLDNLRQLLMANSLCDIIFESYRIIDVEHNKVCELVDGKPVEEGVYCFDVWGRRTPCNHCISFRAHHEDKKIMKLEYNNQKVYLIMAFPLHSLEGSYVLEMMTEVSDSMLVAENLQLDEARLAAVISQLNALSVKDSITHLYTFKEIARHASDLIEDDGGRLYCLAISVDNLTPINELYGYPVGDLMLLRVAQLLSTDFFSKNHWCARVSGNRFVIFFTADGFQSVLQRCHDFQETVAESEISTQDAGLYFTVSMGLHAYDAQLDDAESLINRTLFLLEKGKRQNTGALTY